jgi:hypothetical protein
MSRCSPRDIRLSATYRTNYSRESINRAALTVQKWLYAMEDERKKKNRRVNGFWNLLWRKWSRHKLQRHIFKNGRIQEYLICQIPAIYHVNDILLSLKEDYLIVFISLIRLAIALCLLQ